MMIHLAECPNCECLDSQVVEIRKGLNGFTSEYRQCSHCGKIFQHTPTVTYDPDPVRIICPQCRAKNPPVTKTIPRRDGQGKDLGTVRYHRCGACTKTFKSIEAAGP